MSFVDLALCFVLAAVLGTCAELGLPILLFVLRDLLTSLIDRDVLCLRESCCSLLPRCLGLAGIPRH